MRACQLPHHRAEDRPRRRTCTPRYARSSRRARHRTNTAGSVQGDPCLLPHGRRRRPRRRLDEGGCTDRERDAARQRGGAAHLRRIRTRRYEGSVPRLDCFRQSVNLPAFYAMSKRTSRKEEGGASGYLRLRIPKRQAGGGKLRLLSAVCLPHPTDMRPEAHHRGTEVPRCQRLSLLSTGRLLESALLHVDHCPQRSGYHKSSTQFCAAVGGRRAQLVRRLVKRRLR